MNAFGSSRWLWATLVSLGCTLAPTEAHAFGKEGEFIQTDTLGTSLVSHDYETDKSRSIRKVFNLSEYVGLHRYVLDGVRIGMNLQLTERIWSKAPSDASRITRFALLPQVGWNFYGPMFGALVLGFAPRTDSRARLNLTAQVVLGASFPVSERVRLSVAGEVPFTYFDRRAIGFTALTGVAIRL